MLATLSFSVVFMFLPKEGQIGFPYSQMILTPETWFYFFFEHVIVLILAVVIYLSSEKYKVALMTFVIISLVDTVDYCLTYGEPWWSGPPTWNHIKVFLFGTSIAYERYGK